MFYNPDVLCMRKRGKLARVWLAATLNKRLFKQVVSNAALMSIRIDITCNEIMKVIISETRPRSPRLSLYLSSQLMYGTVKLFNYQMCLLEDFVSRMRAEIKVIDDGPKKKKQRTSSYGDDATREIDLPEPPRHKDAFKGRHLQADLHLLSELDDKAIREGRTRAYVESPTFGELTEEQVELFLSHDDWQLHKIVEPSFHELNEPIRYAADDSNQCPVLPPSVIGQQDLGVTSDFLLGEDTMGGRVEFLEVPRTPKKRGSTMENVDTPTKRRHVSLGDELNTAPPETDRAHPEMDGTHLEMDVAPLELDRAPTADHQKERDDEMLLDSLQSEAFMRPRRLRRRLVIDEYTTLHQTELAKQISNYLIYTVPRERCLVVPVPRRILSGKALLQIPSTTVRSNNYREDGIRYVAWANDLMLAFELRTIGPFTTEDEHSDTAEAIRGIADSRGQNLPGEISSGLGERIGLESSSRNKTAEERSADPINAPSMPEIIEENDQIRGNLRMHDVDIHEIPNQPILENTGDADTVSVTKGFQSDGNFGNVASTSDPETKDIDAFLPPKLRTRSVVKKTSYEKSADGEAIVNIPDSPISFRSDGGIQSEWNRPELLAELAVRWNMCANNETVTFASLAPPETTNRVHAACCFSLLLELHKERILKLVQAEPYGEIHIYKVVRHSTLGRTTTDSV